MTLLKKIILALLTGLFLFVGGRFFLYWRDYRYFSDLAVVEQAQSKERAGSHRAVIIDTLNSDTGLVVLTGDRKRIKVALELLIQKEGQFLIISGIGKGATLTDLINAQTESPIDLKIIWEKIILESQSTSTIENAIECAKILRSKKVTRVILVTSDYHMSRSLALFKKFSPEIEYLIHPTPSDFTDALHGNMDHALEGLYKFIIEFLKDSLFTFYLLSV